MGSAEVAHPFQCVIAIRRDLAAGKTDFLTAFGQRR
jgi:tRNA A37 threonylcarbamoyladenosine biosynthesis protein TsaE